MSTFAVALLLAATVSTLILTKLDRNHFEYVYNQSATLLSTVMSRISIWPNIRLLFVRAPCGDIGPIGRWPQLGEFTESRCVVCIDSES